VPEGPVDAVAVLFNGLNAEKTEVGAGTERRLREGIRRARRVTPPLPLLLIGGKRPPDEPQGGVFMRRWAVAHGVPEERIIVGGASYDTVGNLATIRRLGEQHGWNRVLTVTSPLHAWRIVKTGMVEPPIVMTTYSPDTCEPPLGAYSVWRSVHHNAVAMVAWYLLPRDVYASAVAWVRANTPF